MDDTELKIQTFRPNWEEFKDFPKYIKYIESKGAHKAGLARVIPPPEYIPRKDGYNLAQLNIKIEKPICQAVAKVPGVTDGIYQQVNVPLQSMTVEEFQEKADSAAYKTPAFITNKDLEEQYWKQITSHAGIYGADVNGSITDPDVESWNINKLNTILDFVSRDYNISIAGVNTGYLYFGMWKTTFAWHTEDMDLYSINYLHFGQPKTWYAVPPKFGRKFEKLAAVLFPKSSEACKAFLRHKMTIINPKWLKDYDIPYDSIVQEAGHFMITFPFGYHCGFNHGFNCAESTNFAIERWIEYGKHASICYCCPDSVKISMDAFVKRFQPTIFDAWKAGSTKFAHPEYHINPQDMIKPVMKTLSFKERNPELDLDAILLNPNVPGLAKSQLRGSFFVSAEEEAAALMADLNEPDRKSALEIYLADSSEDEKPKRRRRKKQDSDYDDDWYETKGHEFISEDGKVIKNERGGRPATSRRVPARKTLTPKVEKMKVANPRKSAPANHVEDSCLGGAKVQVIQTKETKVMVMSGKPSEVPNILLQPVKPQQVSPAKPSGPSFNSAFASFLQNQSRTGDVPPELKSPVKKRPNTTPVKAQEILHQQSTPVNSTSPTKTLSYAQILQQKQEAWTNKVLLQAQQTKSPQTQDRATCERIQPYVSGQFQANHTDNGQQSYYTIKTASPVSKSQIQQMKIQSQKQSF